jgi:sugar lactone lactonase YvrE
MTSNAASHSFATQNYGGARFSGFVILALVWLASNTAQAQTTNYVLGTASLVVGSAAGINSVVLGVTPPTASWIATTNAPWLQLTAANQSGLGSTNVIFSYDANPGATRFGTLTIAGQTLTLTQAGSTYISARPVTTLVPSSGVEPEGGGSPEGLAVDRKGNVYNGYSAGDGGASGPILEWLVTSNETATITLIDIVDGSASPTALYDLAVDSAGNIYGADSPLNTIYEALAQDVFQYGEGILLDTNPIALVSSGISNPQGVALDGGGNVYFADTGNNAIKEWTVADSSVITLVSFGLSGPAGVAVDAAGNVYIADSGNNAIKEWIAANSNMITLASTGPSNPNGIAVDGAGNVYWGDGALKEWNAASGSVMMLEPESSSVPFVAVDSTANIYCLDTGGIVELPYAFVDPTPRLEGMAAGSDVLPQVLPMTENLLPPFAPTNDQSWLTITGITNDVVSFSFTANTGPARTANITLLGQTIPITQGTIGTPPTLIGVPNSGNGAVQFSFTNTPSAAFTVLSTTNLSLPLSQWTVAGAATNSGSGLFQFTSPPVTNNAQLYYVVRSP